MRGRLASLRGPGRGNAPRLPDGLLFLAITDMQGNLLWICAAKPGRASDLTAARHNKICAKLRAAGLGAIGDLGYTALEDNPEDPVIITGKRRVRKRLGR